MSLNQFAVRLVGGQEALDGRAISPAGLHGLFYHVMRRYNPAGSNWLHDHGEPKPFTLAPAHYDRQRRAMAGLLISTLSEEAAELIIAAWRKALEERTILYFGEEGSPSRQPCVIGEIVPINATSFERLARERLNGRLGLHFLTATAFSQGRGDLLFPVPANVFRRPYEVWQGLAPTDIRLPADWPDWCSRNVYCVRHDIRTIAANVNRNKAFSGFIGKAWFEVLADRKDERDVGQYAATLAALGAFITFTGCGRKTGMGMGTVERTT